MSIDQRDFQRAVERFEPPQPAFERLLTRRDRKRRNDRITGLVVGLVVLAIMGGALFVGARGGPQIAPVGTPSITPPPLTGPTSQELLPGHDRWLKPGPHWLSRGDLFISFEVPSGWRNVSDVAVHTLDDGEVGFWFPDEVPSDPCNWTDRTVHPGSSVDRLTAALAAQPGTTALADVTLAGYRGRSMQLQGPTGGSNALKDCDATHVDTSFRHLYVRWWDANQFFADGPGQIDRLWILDVHGEPLVVAAYWFPGTSARTRTQIDDIVASIRIR
jgi:hypothetical protein